MSADIKTADLVARAFAIRRERAAIEAQDKTLRDELTQLEQVMLARADEQGATRIATADGTAIVTEEILPQVDDWDSFYQWIRDNNNFHFLQRRVASAAYRELTQNGGAVPGLSSYKKRGVNFRAA